MAVQFESLPRPSAREYNGIPISAIACPIWLCIARLILDRERDHYIWSAPQLLVECLSPANRKGSIERLLADYARISVPEGWLLYPQERTLSSHVLEPGAFTLRQTSATAAISTLRFPDVSINLEDLWKLQSAESLES